MSRAELLQQRSLHGQVFPFIEHVTVYPKEVIGDPAQYHAWTDFLCWAITHEKVGDLIDALDLPPDFKFTEENYPRLCGLICDYSTRAMWADEHELVYMEAH